MIKREFDLHGRRFFVFATDGETAEKLADLIRRGYEMADGPDRCTATLHPDYLTARPCTGRRQGSGGITGGCGEPCSFVMDRGRYTSEEKRMLGEVLDFFTNNSVLASSR